MKRAKIIFNLMPGDQWYVTGNRLAVWLLTHLTNFEVKR